MARAKPDIWMPLYIGDYLAATSHLTAEESGAYLHLLMYEWKNGPLPADDEMLRRITRCSECTWSTAKVVLRPFFLQQPDGTLIQRRLEEEKQRWTEKKRVNVERGRKGGLAKVKKSTSSLL